MGMPPIGPWNSDIEVGSNQSEAFLASLKKLLQEICHNDPVKFP